MIFLTTAQAAEEISERDRLRLSEEVCNQDRLMETLVNSEGYLALSKESMEKCKQRFSNNIFLWVYKEDLVTELPYQGLVIEKYTSIRAADLSGFREKKKKKPFSKSTKILVEIFPEYLQGNIEVIRKEIVKTFTIDKMAEFGIHRNRNDGKITFKDAKITCFYFSGYPSLDKLRCREEIRKKNLCYKTDIDISSLPIKKFHRHRVVVSIYRVDLLLSVKLNSGHRNKVPLSAVMLVEEPYAETISSAPTTSKAVNLLSFWPLVLIVVTILLFLIS